MVDPHRHRTDPAGGATRARLTTIHPTRRPRKNPYLRPWIRALPIDIGRAIERQRVRNTFSTPSDKHITGEKDRG